MSDLLLAYYGDDFTGSTDALEVLTKAGVRTVLFTAPPTQEVLARYEGVRAIGVAGVTRSLAPEAMEAELEPVLEALGRLSPRHIHYKTCSTFDSSPEIGSIGRALDVGRRVLSPRFVPVVVGTPPLGRYCVFGNLFATSGVGNHGRVFRLDRHPTASRHPTTPMTESDLTLHLGRQTDARIALFDLLSFGLSEDERAERLERLVAEGGAVVLFDVTSDQHLKDIGRLICEGDSADRCRFIVGSSGVEQALTAVWGEEEGLSTPREWSEYPLSSHALSLSPQVLVVSGSCSPVTASQLEWAIGNGFAEVAIDTPALAAAGGSAESLAESIAEVKRLLLAGKCVVAHTSKGISDERIQATSRQMHQTTAEVIDTGNRTARLLGESLGRIARSAIEGTSVVRVCIAGGDTSGFAARELGIEAIEMVRPLTPGAPLCRAHAPGSPVHGMEVVFKGGQVGPEDYFGLLRSAEPPAFTSGGKIGSTL